METTISLAHLWQVFKQAWWKILAFVLVVVIAAGVVTQFMLPRKYASSVEFYIVNVNQSVDYTTSQMVGVDQQLAENYVQIIKSDAMMSQICKKLEKNNELIMTNGQVRSMISHSTNNNASTFTITVTTFDAKLAHKIAFYIAQLAPDFVTEITKPGEISTTVPMETVIATLNDKKDPRYNELAATLQQVSEQLLQDTGSTRLLVTGTQNRLECIKVIREPVENPNHVSPSLTKICLLSALLSAIVAYLFFLLRALFNTTIHTESDVKRLTALPVLGTIPSWNTATKKDANLYTYSYYGGSKK